MEENLAEGCTVFEFPLEHRWLIRITNSLERVNKEISKRSSIGGIFPNEASYLRLISALLMEIREEWQIGKPTYFSNDIVLARNQFDLLEPNKQFGVPWSVFLTKHPE